MVLPKLNFTIQKSGKYSYTRTQVVPCIHIGLGPADPESAETTKKAIAAYIASKWAKTAALDKCQVVYEVSPDGYPHFHAIIVAKNIDEWHKSISTGNDPTNGVRMTIGQMEELRAFGKAKDGSDKPSILIQHCPRKFLNNGDTYLSVAANYIANPSKEKTVDANPARCYRPGDVSENAWRRNPKLAMMNMLVNHHMKNMNEGPRNCIFGN